MRMRHCLALVVVSLLPMACSDDGDPVGPSTVEPVEVVDLRVGNGPEAVAGRTLVVHYTGWLYDSGRPDGKGQQFDTSIGRAPFTLVLGARQVIAGWEQGLVGMRAGGMRRLIIPPSLAYGSTGSGPIPPNATLVFEIELLEVR